MWISATHPMGGNTAMAAVCLLYYHLLREGGITHDQTVYLDPAHFDGYAFLTVDSDAPEIDTVLLRQGALLYLLCDLNDMISEYEADYLEQPRTQRILAAYQTTSLAAIPELAAVVRLVQQPLQTRDDYTQYHQLCNTIYRRYVVGGVERLLQASHGDDPAHTGTADF